MQETFLNRIFFDNREAAAIPLPGESGRLPALISGLSAVHRAHFAAALRQRTGRPIVIVAPEQTSAEALCADLAALTGEKGAVVTGRELTLFSADAASRQEEQKRIAALMRLLDGAPITVITAGGLLMRAMPPETLRRCAFTIADGAAVAPEDAQDALLRCGYTRCDEVEGPGQFSSRGGILDFFSPEYPQPVRVEFWGDDVDSMGFFDVSSQRRTDSLKSCRILPAAETLPSLCRGGATALAERLAAMSARAGKREGSATADKLAKTLAEDADRLSGGGSLPAADRYAALIYGELTTAIDYIPHDALVILDQPGRIGERARAYLKQLGDDVASLTRAGSLAAKAGDYALSFDAALRALGERPLYMADAFTSGRCPVEPRSIVSITAKQLPSYAGSSQQAGEDAKHYADAGYRTLILAGDERRAGILAEMLGRMDVRARVGTAQDEPDEGECLVSAGALSAGLEYPMLRLAVLTDTQIAGALQRRTGRKKKPSGEMIASCSDLSEGDLVVHEYHGIGRFAGVVRMPVDGAEKDYIKICYAGSDTLYVPATQLDLVSKYVGAGEGASVRLSKMGGADWTRVKTRAKAAAKELAKGLIQLYAVRARQEGHAFAPDSVWQNEFEESFGFEETDDQLRCIREIKADMESPRPMDRLLCGDVGYGKTEVALRAAMKCVLDGRQAAFLAPTTVLAQQHYQTALQRFFGYPVDIQVLSRFRTGAERKQTLADLKSGKCDLVIGTHSLLQKSVEFKRLGLLIVDEEQRFGVSHKEHIKEMSRQVDVLTLSATPIPRTLNMALSGIRDMSTIEEPPMDRLPVQTFVMEHDWGVICDAIRRELARGGQVYYLHNRVENIERAALRLGEMLGGDVVMGVAHGRMDEEQLSRVMEDMAEGRTQVLVCTTIIETGIDIPNVNTLIIEDADKLGLAQLHQIRGRVGRSNRRASAYLTFRKDKVLTEIAEKRLTAIREFAQFNSGFHIAMRDLEIRGAGSVLGAEQSGHMIDVGYDMYLKLLNEAVLEEKGEKPPVRADCSADLAVTANIPDSYVASSSQRMDLYRRIALIRTEEDADDVIDELIDRFGDLPGPVTALVRVALLRGSAGRAGVTDISQKNGELRFALTEFDMARVSALYASPEYKNRLRVLAGAKPSLALKLGSGAKVLDAAEKFIRDWTTAQGQTVVK